MWQLNRNQDDAIRGIITRERTGPIEDSLSWLALE